MDLKKRLIIANAATVLIPLAITVFIALAIFFAFNNFLGKDISLENYRKLSELRFELMESSNSILSQNPDAIEDENFRNYILLRLSEFHGEMIVIKKDNVIFSSSSLSKIDVAKFLEAGSTNWHKESIRINNTPYAIQGIHFEYKDGTQGKVLLYAPIDPSTTDPANILIILGIIFALSFVATNIFISYQFSHRILQPLYHLQQAASEIRKGNLSYQVIEEGDQEIQDLCHDFELMRVKLKESIHTQLKYEDNRKMLISSISHDLKTPVTSIKGYVEGIIDGIANTPEKKEKYLQTIYKKAHQVDRMIDDLLLYAKLDLNQIPFNFEKTNIDDYLRECLFEYEQELENKNVVLSIQNHLTKPYLIALDRERMKRVLMNILDNSLKYMDKEKGKVEVTLRDTPSSIIIELRDNGSGVSQDVLPHIFERFYRSDISRNEVKGSGLGLAIAKQIIEGHSGRIWAVSHEEAGMSILISLKKT